LRVFAPVDASLPLAGVRVVECGVSALLSDYLRLLHGVFEGQQELPTERALPLEAQLQHHGGVSFHKGCYLGQELVARTAHTGELHKALFTLRRHAPHALHVDRARLIPAGFLDSARLERTDAAESADDRRLAADATWTTAEGGLKSGRVLRRVLDLAVGYVRFEHLRDADAAFRLRSDSETEADKAGKEEAEWRLVYPAWWAELEAAQK
jgi:folate-binding protein YgfZ